MSKIIQLVQYKTKFEKQYKKIVQMKDLKFYQEIPFQSLEFLDSLKKKEVCEYKPVNHSITNAGSKLSMGFSCYAAKILIMTGQWDNFSEQDKLKWRDYRPRYAR